MLGWGFFICIFCDGVYVGERCDFDCVVVYVKYCDKFDGDLGKFFIELIINCLYSID